jgi:hypothetical protein
MPAMHPCAATPHPAEHMFSSAAACETNGESSPSPQANAAKTIRFIM